MLRCLLVDWRSQNVNGGGGEDLSDSRNISVEHLDNETERITYSFIVQGQLEQGLIV